MVPSLARIVKKAVVEYSSCGYAYCWSCNNESEDNPKSQDYRSLNELFGLKLSAPDEKFLKEASSRCVGTSYLENRHYYELALAGGQSPSMKVKYYSFFKPNNAVVLYTTIAREGIDGQIYKQYRDFVYAYGYEEDKNDPEIVKMRLNLEDHLASNTPPGYLTFVAIFGVVDKQRLSKILMSVDDDPRYSGFSRAKIKEIIGTIEVTTGVKAGASRKNIDRLLEALYNAESQDVIAELEQNILSESLPIAIMYARDHKGPWRDLEAALIKSGNRELIEKYKAEVLYGEEYE
jgi:hypothetical protein